MVAKKKQKEQKEEQKEQKKPKQKKPKQKEPKQKECFIIMPIREVVDGYPDGHFKRVYEDIIIPACDLAKFTPVRADNIKQTNLIHVAILLRLINAPLAICDLSTGNPNVLFELGIRQAFDKPVVVIQDSETPLIFDTALLRHIEYSKEMKYHDVCYIQKELKAAIEATVIADRKKDKTNSIINLLELGGPAQMSKTSRKKRDATIDLDSLRSEMERIHTNVEKLVEFNIRQQQRGTSSDTRERQRVRERGWYYAHNKPDPFSSRRKPSSDDDE